MRRRNPTLAADRFPLLINLMVNQQEHTYSQWDGPTDVHLDAVFKALSHPARRAMLARLGRGPATVGELALPLGMTAPAVTKHIRVLARARLITQGREARWRPCRLEEAPLLGASDWLDQQKKVWESRLDRLEAHLNTMTNLHTMTEEGPAKGTDDGLD